jgi:selenocysteine lyase/cysteine desulfurase
VQLHTPLSAESSAGIICFDVDGLKPGDVVERLKQRKIIASETPKPYRTDHARLAPGLLTSEADVESALAAVRALA